MKMFYDGRGRIGLDWYFGAFETIASRFEEDEVPTRDIIEQMLVTVDPDKKKDLMLDCYSILDEMLHDINDMNGREMLYMQNDCILCDPVPFRADEM